MTTLETLGQPAIRTRELGSFSVDTYLDRRATNPNFVMVEIGHDSLPVAYQQEPQFRGQRAYIGIEAWLRDRQGTKHAYKETTHRNFGDGQNIFYIAQRLGGIVRYDEENPKYSWYEGEYETETLLPDESADEVFISNVFCDPHVAYSWDATASLLAESARLVESDGVIVLRETITPGKVGLLTNSLVHTTGLKVEGVVKPSDQEMWEKLETFYKAEPSKHSPSPGSYYLFLAKQHEK